jgi:hypothetical protein
VFGAIAAVQADRARWPSNVVPSTYSRERGTEHASQEEGIQQAVHPSRICPRDSSTSRHFGQCEYVSETDPTVLKVLLKVKPGLGEGYDWVECGGCGAGWQVPYYAESVG